MLCKSKMLIRNSVKRLGISGLIGANHISSYKEKLPTTHIVGFTELIDDVRKIHVHEVVVHELCIAN